jgi:hypothetical protein
LEINLLRKTELYNLSNDIGEHHDLIAKYPKKATELIQLLNAKLTAENAQFPIDALTNKILKPVLIN